ncbi:Hypothetical protein MVR_LOCUS314 [uncultured virus]|nr:Hypothetical protein MVR_LOCUS314 [uncultured virus]
MSLVTDVNVNQRLSEADEALKAKTAANAKTATTKIATTKTTATTSAASGARKWFSAELPFKYKSSAFMWNKIIKAHKAAKGAELAVPQHKDQVKMDAKFAAAKSSLSEEMGHMSYLETAGRKYSDSTLKFENEPKGWLCVYWHKNEAYIVVDPLVKAICTLISGKGALYKMTVADLIKAMAIKGKTIDADCLINLPTALHPSNNRSMIGVKPKSMQVLFDFIESAVCDKQIQRLISKEDDDMKGKIYSNCMTYDCTNVTKLVSESMEERKKFQAIKSVTDIIKRADKAKEPKKEVKEQDKEQVDEDSKEEAK